MNTNTHTRLMLGLLFLSLSIFSFGATPEMTTGKNTEVITPFRAVSNDGGGGGDEIYCLDEVFSEQFTVIIGSAYNNNVSYLNCGKPVRLYAHLEGDFSQMVGVSETMNFTTHPQDDNYLIALGVQVPIDLSPYETQECLDGDNDIDIRFVLVYQNLKGSSYMEYTNCKAYFPPGAFVPDSEQIVHHYETFFSCTGDSPPTSSKEFCGDQGGSYAAPSGGNPKSMTARPELLNAVIQPNPFAEQLQIQINATQAEALQVTLFDTQGRQWLSQEMQLEPGRQNYALSTTNLPPGAYWVQLRSNSQLLSLKAIKTP